MNNVCFNASSGLSYYNNSKNVTFGRKIPMEQKDDYEKAVKDALVELDKKNLAIITHGPSFPSVFEDDTGMGSPYSDGAAKFMNFLRGLGFNSVQMGPGGNTKKTDASPYTSTVFSNNTLFIDLKPLTTSEWAGILPEDTLKDIVANKGKASDNYAYVYERQSEALRDAWANYKAKVENPSDENKEIIENIETKFAQYKESNKMWLNNDALYEALIKANDDQDYWKNWNETDRDLPRLLVSSNKNDRKKAQARIDQIKSDPVLADEMEFYKFCQLISSVQCEQLSQKTDMKTIADVQVTYGDRDWWAFQNLFLDNYRLGAPPDYFSADGQPWGFPVMDPEKLFVRNKNGSIKMEEGKPVLGEAGKLIKVRFDKMFKENPGGVRIDHIVGLIDPWVYPNTANTAKREDGGYRLFSSPDTRSGIVKFLSAISAKLPEYIQSILTKAMPSLKPSNALSQWSKVPKDGVDNDVPRDTNLWVKQDKITPEITDKYAEIIDIIIQSAKDNGVPVSNIICEDLGTLTNPVVEVLKSRGLSGLRVTQFVNATDKDHMYRGKNVDPKHWIVPGTHDNETLISWTEKLQNKEELGMHAKALAEDLKLDAKKLESDRNEFITAKFAELFASPAQNIQMMFSDFLGIRDKYNDPGAKKPEELIKNWRLRVPTNYENFYYKQLQRGKGLNIPEALEIAMNSKDDQFKTKNESLIKKLHEFAEILKQPEK